MEPWTARKVATWPLLLCEMAQDGGHMVNMSSGNVELRCNVSWMKKAWAVNQRIVLNWNWNLTAMNVVVKRVSYVYIFTLGCEPELERHLLSVCKYVAFSFILSRISRLASLCISYLPDPLSSGVSDNLLALVKWLLKILSGCLNVEGGLCTIETSD